MEAKQADSLKFI